MARLVINEEVRTTGTFVPGQIFAFSGIVLHADPTGVFMAITAAHDFGHDAPQWRWSPDLAVYDRAVPETDPPTESENTDDS
jgi:hypothetical protein